MKEAKHCDEWCSQRFAVLAKFLEFLSFVSDQCYEYRKYWIAIWVSYAVMIIMACLSACVNDKTPCFFAMVVVALFVVTLDPLRNGVLFSFVLPFLVLGWLLLAVLFILAWPAYFGWHVLRGHAALLCLKALSAYQFGFIPSGTGPVVGAMMIGIGALMVWLKLASTTETFETDFDGMCNLVENLTPSMVSEEWNFRSVTAVEFQGKRRVRDYWPVWTKTQLQGFHDIKSVITRPFTDCTLTKTCPEEEICKFTAADLDQVFDSENTDDCRIGDVVEFHLERCQHATIMDVPSLDTKGKYSVEVLWDDGRSDVIPYEHIITNDCSDLVLGSKVISRDGRLQGEASVNQKSEIYVFDEPFSGPRSSIRSLRDETVVVLSVGLVICTVALVYVLAWDTPPLIAIQIIWGVLLLWMVASAVPVLAWCKMRIGLIRCFRGSSPRDEDCGVSQEMARQQSLEDTQKARCDIIEWEDKTKTYINTQLICPLHPIGTKVLAFPKASKTAEVTRVYQVGVDRFCDVTVRMTCLGFCPNFEHSTEVNLPLSQVRNVSLISPRRTHLRWGDRLPTCRAICKVDAVRILDETIAKKPSKKGELQVLLDAIDDDHKREAKFRVTVALTMQAGAPDRKRDIDADGRFARVRRLTTRVAVPFYLMPIADNYSDVAQSISFASNGQPLYCVLNMFGICWNVGLSVAALPPQGHALWYAFDVSSRLFQADVVEASVMSLAAGRKVRLYFEKTALQASTESLYNVAVVVYAVLEQARIRRQVPGIFEDADDWLKIAIGFVLVYGDVGMLSNLSLSMWGIFDGIGRSAQWLVRFRSSEEQEHDISIDDEFQPRDDIAMFRLLECLSFSVTSACVIQHASNQQRLAFVSSMMIVNLVTFYPIQSHFCHRWPWALCQGCLGCRGFAYDLVDTSHSHVTCMSLLILFVRSLIWPAAPDTFIWPIDLPIGAHHFRWFCLIRTIFFLFCWLWLMSQSKLQAILSVSEEPLIQIVKICLLVMGVSSTMAIIPLATYLGVRHPERLSGHVAHDSEAFQQPSSASSDGDL